MRRLSPWIAALVLGHAVLIAEAMPLFDRIETAIEEWSQSPCDHDLQISLKDLLDEIKFDSRYARSIVEITALLLSCEPHNGDYLYLSGKGYYWLKDDSMALRQLKKAIALQPADFDTAYLLAQVYQIQHQEDQAIALMLQFPDVMAAVEKLGDLYLAKNDLAKARQYYEQVYRHDQSQGSKVKKLADLYYTQRRYFQADDLLKDFLKDVPMKELESLQTAIQAFTRPALSYQINFIHSKENDPTIAKPVVATDYLQQLLQFDFPIHEGVFTHTKFQDFRQKEDDIIPPVGTNYNVKITALEEQVRFDTLNHWQFDAFLRLLDAHQIGTNFYPFISTQRIEPGLSVSYLGFNHYFFIEGHIESMIIKNFSVMQSELLRQDVVSAGYGHIVTQPIQGQLELNAAMIAYHDAIGNREWVQTILMSLAHRFHHPGSLGVAIRLDHSSFDQLTPNYFSYQQQWAPLAKLFFDCQIHPAVKIEGAYYRGWQLTRNLLQPIGNFLLVENRQLLSTQRVEAALTLIIKTHLKATVNAHYFITSLPYREYRLAGTLSYQF